ncbi:hypothetical protein EVAR_34495_1 [Eumeta japonica]|uniref:Uncharacterized protein n=1 Tax=Eumeta variegata TaxID=151549 RepID=A0A4C1WVV5_EUMVA|nr:hypothetical protein EVAR_34495_1 [Eumeta japonica]
MAIPAGGKHACARPPLFACLSTTSRSWCVFEATTAARPRADVSGGSRIEKSDSMDVDNHTRTPISFIKPPASADILAVQPLVTSVNQIKRRELPATSDVCTTNAWSRKPPPRVGVQLTKEATREPPSRYFLNELMPRLAYSERTYSQ